MINGKTIVVLGGGSGGIVCVNELRKRLSSKHKIILIDKEDTHLYYPSLLWLLFGWRKPEQIQRPLIRLNKKGIEFVQGEINRIDIKNRLVYVNGREKEINFDYLIISLGAELNRTNIPKTESIYNFYCLEGAKLAGDVINHFTGGKIAVLISSSPFKCPAAPYETALLLAHHFQRRNIRNKIDIQVYTPETLPMPTAGVPLGTAVKQILEQKGIGFNPGLKFGSIDASKKEIKFETRTEQYDLLLVVPPHQIPKVVKDTDLTQTSPWIPVDAGTLKTNHANVFAIGDICGIKLPNGKMLPKAGVFAHYQAEVVARNIVHQIIGNPETVKFDGRGECFLELGEGLAGFAKGNFYTQPEPVIKLYKPSFIWHWSKLIFEKWWLSKWF